METVAESCGEMSIGMVGVRVDWLGRKSSSRLRGCGSGPVSRSSINEASAAVDRDSTGRSNMGALVSHGQSSLKSKDLAEVVPRL